MSVSRRFATGVLDESSRSQVLVRYISQSRAALQAKDVPGIYVANLEGRQNTSPILLGLMDYFERHLSSIGFFQPVRIEVSSPLALSCSKHHASAGMPV